MSGIEDPHRKRPPTALKNAFDWFAVTRRASIISSPRARSIVELTLVPSQPARTKPSYRGKYSTVQ
jgi:hypothetical protein